MYCTGWLNIKWLTDEVKDLKTSLGGLEPPTFRLIAERTNLLRHRDHKHCNCVSKNKTAVTMMNIFYCALTAFLRLFFFFLKKSRDLSELYTAGRYHGLSLNRSPAWTSRLLSGPRRPLDCRKPHCGLRGTKGNHFGSNHTNNIGVLGLSVPQGSHNAGELGHHHRLEGL